MSIDRIIFGSMTLGYRGRGARVRDARIAQQMLDTFRQHGHREVDTCYVYGDGSCEQLLGDLYAGEDFEIAVRYDPIATPGGHEPQMLRSSLRASLERLNTDRAALLYLNVRGNDTPWDDTLRAVHELHEEGLFAELGLSNLSPADVEETLALTERHDWIRPTVYQGLYNAISRTAETNLLPLLHERGLRFHAYNPLAGGAFAPSFGNDTAITEGSRFDPQHAQGAQYRQRYWTEPYLRAMHELRSNCMESAISPIDAALRWLVHHSRLDGTHGDGIILGASRPEHLAQNLGAVHDGPLPTSVLDAIDNASEITRPTWPPMYPTL
ncbi:aldo/keto reductase [Streptomyces sulfonofaciens]|uniref:Aldo/keto reductase n=1 Tax=Streptomyces sulfonofaciens TaxID=68272 RepID=A0A919GQ43_9ACTN|nr:aldo/keto reductase [Streptomyces sulfonofaciens]GHH88733.1 aldo/keto reductase [Streptomyces sulfonofaciens]